VSHISDAAERRHGERRSVGRRLTDRQAAILELVSTGLENKEIAHRLGISEQAVKEHVSNLLRVLAAPNRAALGDLAATRRFVGTTDIDPEWLRFLFQEAPMHVAIVSGREHRFVAVNDAYRQSTGGLELVGLRYADAFPDRAESLTFLDRAYRTGERVVASATVRRFVAAGETEARDGHVTFVLQPLPGTDGATAGVAIFSIDVTAEVRARQELRDLEREQLTLLDALAVGVIISDERGRLVKANKAAGELLTLPAPPARLSPELVAPYDLRDGADGTPVAFADIPTVRAIAGQRSGPRVFVVVDPVSKRDRRIRMSAVPLFRDDGTVRGTVTTFDEVRPGG
jgi:PAS domain-containing protein